MFSLKKNLVSDHNTVRAAQILRTLYIISSIHPPQWKLRLNSFTPRQSSYCIRKTIIWGSCLSSPGFVVPSIVIMFLDRAMIAKVHESPCVFHKQESSAETLSQCCLQVYSWVYIVITKQTWISGQSIMGKHWIIVWRARAGSVLTGWRILFKRGRQIQVLKKKENKNVWVH